MLRRLRAITRGYAGCRDGAAAGLGTAGSAGQAKGPRGRCRPVIFLAALRQDRKVLASQGRKTDHRSRRPILQTVRPPECENYLSMPGMSNPNAIPLETGCSQPLGLTIPRCELRCAP